MYTIKAQQKLLDDAIVAPENRLKIRKCNQRLSPTLKSNEPTIQVALDALKLTPFYNAFDVSAYVPKIYIQEFWATVTKHHFSLRFKMNGKSHTVNVDNFRDMLKICPKLPGQKFEDPPFEEEILSFIRDLGHTGEIKVLSDVNVNHLHQPWRSFAAIINKCLSGKTTALESLRLSRAQILWGMYHNKNVDYVYLLWEDLVYQVENKNSKKNNDMYYPRFTKVIVDYFMAKDQAIPRRNKMFWHYARDDFMFTTIRVISKHQDTQVYDAILPQHLTNQAMLESEAYKTYLAYATGEKIPKPKYGKNKADSESSPKKKTATTAKGKRLKTSAKAAKPAKKKQPAKTSKAKGLTVLSEVALTEAEQMKLATKRSLIETHSSHASGSGADEGTGLNDNDDDNDDDEDNDDDDDDADNQDDDDQEDDGQDYEEQDDVNEQTDSDNDGDDFVHPKLSTHDEEDKEEEDSDPRVHTPSNYASTDDEESDEEIQGANVEGEEMDEEETNKEDKANELYRDVNINLEGRDTEMTDAPCTIVQTTQVIEDTHVIITRVNPEAQQQSSSVSSGFVSNMLNPSQDTCINSIFNLNTESTSLIDVPVTTIAEPPLLSTTLPPPPTPLITYLQQTPATIPSSSIQDLPNVGSLFGFNHTLKTLENDFLEFKQTNQFVAAIYLILGIVDTDKAQAENVDFINKLDDNIKKIIKDQVKEQVKAQVSKILLKIKKTVNEQLEAEVLTRSSNESKTSHAIAANLSELKPKKILIDKMESNNSIHRSDEQKNLYKALVDAYESDKLILDTYGYNVLFKRRQDDEDKDEEPSVGSNQGSKRRRAGKESESTSAPKEKSSKTTRKSTEGSKSHHKSAGESTQAEEPRHTTKYLEEPAHLEFKTGVTEDQLAKKIS
ncbi:hypothetical protein Tco_0774155 [Tanacetum coccineum]|uniref:Uncharacterized protein n=1 Tax=Tanacetum coccineum TaxID=301880 RepID=A0ABQ4ZMQ1_9ASTR